MRSRAAEMFATRLRKLRRLLHQDRGDRLGVRVSLECLLAREQLVEDRPEREDVRAVIDRESFHLLGRHVADRPHDRPGLRVSRVRRGARLLARGNGLDSLRQAEVEDLDVAVSRDEEVLGLQVPVDDALSRAPRRGPWRPAARSPRPVFWRDRTRVELPAQRVAFQKLHDGIGDAVLRSEVEDREDVRMGKRRDRLRFALEPRERVGIGRDGLGQNLDRDVSIELLVPRPVDLAHPARRRAARGSRRGRDECRQRVSTDDRGEDSIPSPSLRAGTWLSPPARGSAKGPRPRAWSRGCAPAPATRVVSLGELRETLSRCEQNDLSCKESLYRALAPEFAAREVSRGNRGRRRAPRERERSVGIRLAVEAASGRAASRCA